MATIVNMDGKLVSPEEAKISVFDRSFLFGDSVYETLRTYGGKIFAISQHVERLFESDRRIDLYISVGEEEIAARCQQTVDAGKNDESYCRLMVTRGVGSFGLASGLETPGSVLVMVRPYEPLDPVLYNEGLAGVIPKVRRNPPEALDPAIKSGNYLNNILGALEARRQGADDAVFLSLDGFVSEATTSSLFVVKEGVLKTPPLSVGILSGITRGLTLEVARAEGVAVETPKFTREDLLASDEVFLTSTLKEVVPVRSVDGVVVGSGSPGPLARRLGVLLHKKILELMKEVGRSE